MVASVGLYGRARKAQREAGKTLILNSDRDGRDARWVT